MPKAVKSLDKIVKPLLLISVIILFSSVFYLVREVKVIKEKTGIEKVGEEPSLQAFQVCGENCKEEIQKAVSKAVATLSATPITQVTKTTVQTKQKTSYIPLGGTSAITTSTDWVDVKDSEVYLDLANEYGKDAKVSWDAFLKATHGGEAMARLYDVTHKIVVLGSEISTKETTSAQVSSGNLSLWSGRNLYRVQIKSLNSFEITYTGGRVKITY